MWAIKWAYENNVQNMAGDKLDDLLLEGWEPFAVSDQGGYSVPKIYLRTEVDEDYYG